MDHENGVHGMSYFFIVGYDDKGDLGLRRQIQEQVQNFSAVFGVQVTCWFIAQQNRRFMYNGSGNGRPLLLSTG